MTKNLKYGFSFYEDIAELIGRNYWSNGQVDIEQTDSKRFLIVDLDGGFIGEENTLEEAVEYANECVPYTNKICFRCDGALFVETEIEDYDYFCPECDENMFEFEAIDIEK